MVRDLISAVEGVRRERRSNTAKEDVVLAMVEAITVNGDSEFLIQYGKKKKNKGKKENRSERVGVSARRRATYGEVT